MGFKLTHSLPERCFVGVSGGIDSVSALHWLSQVPGRVQGIVHIHHNTGKFADASEELVSRLAKELGFNLKVYRVTEKASEGSSQEEFWRNQRHQFFREHSQKHQNAPIVLAHNFDDCLEEYIIATMVRGFSGTIPYRHGPCVRPFRLWKRAEIIEYAISRRLPHLEDPANGNTSFLRSKVRVLVAPRVLSINPGVYNIVERVIREQDSWNEANLELED